MVHAVQPQNSIPDVIIWMLCGNQRTAYYRVPAHELIYSSKAECRGELCSKIQTLTLKASPNNFLKFQVDDLTSSRTLSLQWPGKEAEDKNKKDTLPGQIRVKLWLGLEKDEKVWLTEHTNENENGEISIFAETVSA